MRRMILLSIAAGGMLAAGGCGTTAKTSSAALKLRLLPASSIPGFDLQRTMNWSDPIDLVGQGVALPETTPPSAGVRELRGAHLEGASGEVIQKGAGLGATEIRLGVAKFSSTDNANRVRTWMHEQDLRQPCFAACVFSPRATRLPGVPNSSGVIQAEAVSHPTSPTNYRAEFTIGPYLYWVWGQADALPTTQRQFMAGVSRYYDHARKSAS